MHVFRVGASRKALVLTVVTVDSMGAIPSSHSSGVVATPWAFAPTKLGTSNIDLK
jgi:acid phosphatase family membrane protein YuiD